MHRLQHLVVTALVFHFGIETLRALLPLLVFGLRDRFGWAALGPMGAVRILGIAFGLFVLTFFAGRLSRWLGRRAMLRGCVVGLVIFRWGAQLWSADPIGNLLAMMLSLLCFLLFWPIWSSPLTAGPEAAAHGRQVILGVLLGGTLSASLHGLLLTYDAIWRNDPPHLILALVLGSLLWIALLRLPMSETIEPAVLGLSWFAWGPYVFLQLMLFLNLSRLTVLSGLEQPWAAAVQVVCQVLGLVLVMFWSSHGITLGGRRLRWATLALLLLAGVAVPWPVGPWALLGLLAGQLGAAGLISHLSGHWPSYPAHGTTHEADRWKTLPVCSHGIGSLLLLLLIFLYYAGYDLPIPFEQVRLLPLAAAFLALAAWPSKSSLRSRTVPHPLRTPKRGLVLVGILALVLLPLMRVTDSHARKVVHGEDSTQPSELRVMTYNLHCGFGAYGYLRLEEQARVIEAQDPDIVALQEVSRGWIINGGVDILAWLAHRLDMDYRFAPTADPLWGNAILSRRPIVSSRHLDFPRGSKQQIQRGLVEIVVATGDGAPLTILNTHFHHRRQDSDVRGEQARLLLDAWNEHPRSVLLGDFNALPESPEMESIRDAGFEDVAGHGLISPNTDPGYTFRADRLQRRIDYIWTSADLESNDVVVPPSTASDHLSIAATVRWER